MTKEKRLNCTPEPPQTEPGIGYLIKLALWVWGRTSIYGVLFILRSSVRVWRANNRRKQKQRLLHAPIPSVVAVSPTMRCNYNCKGCYSRSRPLDNELSADELETLFTEAEALGVLSIVVTGGEPLLRDDLRELMARHRRLLFVLITNGSLLTPEKARDIAKCGNVIVLVSIEGFASETDGRRQSGAYDRVMRTFGYLRQAGLCFGFAATNTAANTARLGSDEFIEKMIDVGCTLGFFTEYVPCGPNPVPQWALDETARAVFRERVLALRRRKRIVLIQFPHDEYGENNLCMAAGRASIHINAQGDVEPCPFMPVSRENIRDGGLLAACLSPFLRAIREDPALLKRKRFACSLFEHRTEIENLAEEIGSRQK